MVLRSRLLLSSILREVKILPQCLALIDAFRLGILGPLWIPDSKAAWRFSDPMDRRHLKNVHMCTAVHTFSSQKRATKMSQKRATFFFLHTNTQQKEKESGLQQQQKAGHSNSKKRAIRTIYTHLHTPSIPIQLFLNG